MSVPSPKDPERTPPEWNPVSLQSAPPTPPPRGKGRKRLVIGATAVVLVLVVVAFLILSGTVSLSPSRGEVNPPAFPHSSASALAAAEPIVNRITGGPWTLATVYGVDLTGGLANTTAGSAAAPPLPVGCKASRESPSSIPRYSGNYSSGSFVSWFFYFVNATATSVVSVEVTNGYANVTYEFSSEYSGICFFLPPDPLPMMYVSSTVAAEAAWGGTNVTDFLHSHASSNAEFLLGRSDAAPGMGTVWYISYSDCGYSWPQLEVAGANSVAATVNATTGALESSTSSVNCVP